MIDKPFIVLPGPITSVNDWDAHCIRAEQLMQLHGVHPRECIVIRNANDLLGRGDLFNQGREVLEPRVGHYHRYTAADRVRIRERIHTTMGLGTLRFDHDPPGTAALADRLSRMVFWSD